MGLDMKRRLQAQSPSERSIAFDFYTAPKRLSSIPVARADYSAGPKTGSGAAILF
jgi:hypothetical protein